AIIQLGDLIVADSHLDAAVLAVQSGVGGVVAEDVVAGNVLLSLDDAGGQVIAIDKQLAASVVRQSVEGVLRSLKAALPGGHGAAGEIAAVTAAAAARGAHVGIADRGTGYQPRSEEHTSELQSLTNLV